ncbi:MAG: hypothetical protein ACRCVA_15565 [Phreatobacter sp.]
MPMPARPKPSASVASIQRRVRWQNRTTGGVENTSAEPPDTMMPSIAQPPTIMAMPMIAMFPGPGPAAAVR